MMTGGDPGVTGFYYDDTYNYDVFPPGTTKCVGTPPGGQVNYDNTIDVLSLIHISEPTRP